MTGMLASSSRTVFRPHRRYSVVLTSGLAGVHRVIDTLLVCGCRISDFATDLHDGVGVTQATVTIAATTGEAEIVAEHLRRLPDVASVDLG